MHLANHVFWPLMHLYTPLLLLLQLSVQWLSIVNFNNDAKPPPKWILREFDVSRIRPRPGGLPHLETFTWQNLTPAERVTRSGRPGYPPWRVTPPKPVTSPTWGPSPPCKQALKIVWANFPVNNLLFFYVRIVKGTKCNIFTCKLCAWVIFIILLTGLLCDNSNSLTYEPRKGQSLTLSRANCNNSNNSNLNVWRSL